MSETTIDLVTPQGMVLEGTAIPNEYTVEEIVQELIENLGLPRFDSGRNVDYSLVWVNQNLTLTARQTLTDVGVSPGDRLKLVSSAPIQQPALDNNPPIPLQVSDTEGSVEVVLSVLDLNKSTAETFDLDVKVEDLIKIIAKKHRLPDRDELNVAATYYVKSKFLGRVLGPSETLRAAGVPKHDRLSVLRAEVAG